jgi:hypothetical protein
MTKKAVFYSILILAFNTGNLFGQKVFREGYIVKNSGEILNGLVEYSVNQKTPSSCVFRRFEIATKVIYSASDIKAFGYRNGNRYESLSFESQTSFFEVLAKGKINLYLKGSGYYLEIGNSGIINLSKTPVTLSLDGESNQFPQVQDFLKYITKNEVSIPDKFSLKNDLIPVVTSFNIKNGEVSQVYNRSISSAKIDRMAHASGVNMTSLGVVGGTAGYMLRMRTSDIKYLPAPVNEFCPAIGLTFERILSRMNDKWSLYLEITGYEQTFYSYSEYTYSSYTSRNDAFFDFTAIKVPLMLKYTLPGKKYIPFLNAGIACQYFLDHNFRHISETENSIHEVQIAESSEFTFKPKEMSVLIGGGIKTRLYNNIFFSLQGRVEFGQGLFIMGNSQHVKESSIQPSILIGFTF